MKAIYLIQSELANVSYKFPDDVDSLLLVWGEIFKPEKGSSLSTFHFPNSTWSEGRNELYRRALEIGNYDYFVFCDDDIRFDFELNEFHTLIEHYQPERAVPDLLGNNFYHYSLRQNPVTALKYVDHAVMALSAKAARALLPYTNEFDDINWWLTCEEFCEDCWDKFQWQTLKFNKLNIHNLLHRDYPKKDYPGLPSNQFKTPDLLKD